MKFNDLVALINEEYTYYLSNVKDSKGNMMKKSLDLDLDNTYDDLMFTKERERHNFAGKEYKHATVDNVNRPKGADLLKWFTLFHEAEYKRGIMQKYGIECPDCDNIINIMFEYVKKKNYLITQQWLLWHHYENDFFDAKGHLKDWKFLNDQSVDRSGDPRNYKFHSVTDVNPEYPDTERVLKDFNYTRQLLEKAKTIPEKVIAITKTFNVYHHRGSIIADYWGLGDDAFMELESILTNSQVAKKWNAELYKEFGIK